MGSTAGILGNLATFNNIGAGVGALSSVVGGAVKAGQADSEAKALKLEARQNAENILRATSRRVGEARAATAASGVKIDQFSVINENAIQEAGESDAAMTILNGKMAARSRRSQGQLAFAKGLGGAAATLMKADFGGASESLMRPDLSGWKGMKGTLDAPGSASATSSDPYDRFRMNRT